MTKNITNIATGEILQNFKIEYLLNSVEQGETLYKQFVETRLIEHSKSLFYTLTKRNKKEPVSSIDKPVDIGKENVKALKYIDIARTRDFDIDELLKYELSKQSRYLTKEKSSYRGTSKRTYYKRSSDKRRQTLYIIRFYGLCKEGACQN